MWKSSYCQATCEANDRVCSAWLGPDHKHDYLCLSSASFLPRGGNYHKNYTGKGADMRCNVKTHPLIVNEIFFFKLNVILHPPTPQPHHDSGGKFVEMVELKKKKRKPCRHTNTTFTEHQGNIYAMKTLQIMTLKISLHFLHCKYFTSATFVRCSMQRLSL